MGCLQEDEREKRADAEGKDGIYPADSFRTGRKKSIHQNREERGIRPHTEDHSHAEHGESMQCRTWSRHASREQIL